MTCTATRSRVAAMLVLVVAVLLSIVGCAAPMGSHSESLGLGTAVVLELHTAAAGFTDQNSGAADHCGESHAPHSIAGPAAPRVVDVLGAPQAAPEVLGWAVAAAAAVLAGRVRGPPGPAVASGREILTRICIARR